jgi:hypothetical protein
MNTPQSNTPQSKWQNVERAATAAAHAKEISDLKNQINQLAEAANHGRAQLETALALKKNPGAIAPIRRKDGDESEAVAFAVASDWHVEETVDPRAVNGLNEFSLEIADARIEQFFRSVVRLTEISRHGTKIDTLVLAMLGDAMTGYIHEELQESNGLSPTQTVLWLIQRIKRGIGYLKAEGGFERIIVPCSYGNHGRTTKKPRNSTGAANSYEWMMYHILADACPAAEWQIADGYHNYLDLYGKTIRLHHGDNIAYQGGIGGITISVEKAIASWNKARVADLDVFGHHHTQQQNPKWVANGSLIGYGAYSLAIKAPFEPPQQTFFLFDSARGRTITAPIHLT